MKLVFFGSSDFSIPVLDALVRSRHSVDLIVTTPPQKKGRGRKESESRVADWASEHRLVCAALPLLTDRKFLTELSAIRADCFVVASYGKMLPGPVLKIPLKYPLNVHPSLLPKYRGAAPIQCQLLSDEHETGVSIAKITSKLDAGEILLQKKIPILETDDAISLSEKLSALGGELVLDALDKIEHNEARFTPQDDARATYAAKLTKAMGKIDWSKNAKEIQNQIRAFTPWPSAYAFWKNKRIKMLKSELVTGLRESHAPGTILKIDPKGLMLIQATGGAILVSRLQPESGKAMDPYSFSLGYQIKAGDRWA